MTAQEVTKEYPEKKSSQSGKWEIIKNIGPLSQAIATLITAGVVGLIGYWLQYTYQLASQRSNRTQVYTQIMGQREEAESSLRKDMFTNFIKTFTEPNQTSLKSRILNLELLAYNFHESLDLKPIFMDIKRDIEVTSKRQNANQYLGRIEDLSKEIKNQQLSILQNNGGKSFTWTFELENPDSLNLPFRTQRDTSVRVFSLRLLDYETIEQTLTVQFTAADAFDNALYRNTREVNLFDFPMINNIRMPCDQRVALYLPTDFVDGNNAQITLVYFQGSYASLKEKPYFDEIAKKLLLDEGLKTERNE